MLQEKQYKREVARKTSIAEILRAGEAFTAKRVNILATVVEKEERDAPTYGGIIVDDGSGQIRLRFFDNESQLSEKAELGDFVLIIGKPRRYAAETYIAPEILKVIDNVKWAEVRKLELRMTKAELPEAGKTEEGGRAGGKGENDVVSKDKLELYRIIKELDSGRGADVGEVATKFGGTAETIIREMIKNGDLFEVLPGRLKVLE